MAEPVVFYRAKWKAEDMTVELFEKMREKCRGVRVFYFNPNGNESDHVEHHKDGWKKENEADVGGEKEYTPKEDGTEKRSSCNGEEMQQAFDKEEMKKMEAGTVVELLQYELIHEGYDGCNNLPETRYCVVIKWDCGYERVYGQSDLESIRVFDLGPTGLSSW